MNYICHLAILNPILSTPYEDPIMLTTMLLILRSHPNILTPTLLMLDNDRVILTPYEGIFSLLRLLGIGINDLIFNVVPN